MSNEQFHLCETVIFKKCITFFFPILLGLFHSWDKFDTMGMSSRTGVISVIYKKDDKKDTAKYSLISLLNLDFKIYISIAKNRMQIL